MKPIRFKDKIRVLISQKVWIKLSDQAVNKIYGRAVYEACDRVHDRIWTKVWRQVYMEIGIGGDIHERTKI